MDVSLNSHFEAFVAQKLRNEGYNSPSDIMHEALKLLEEQDTFKLIKLEALRRDIDEGLAQLDRGEGRPLDIEDIKARGRERLKQFNK